MAPLFVYVVHTLLGVEEERDGELLSTPLSSHLHTQKHSFLFSASTLLSHAVSFSCLLPPQHCLYFLSNLCYRHLYVEVMISQALVLIFVYLLHYFCYLCFCFLRFCAVIISCSTLFLFRNHFSKPRHCYFQLYIALISTEMQYSNIHCNHF